MIRLARLFIKNPLIANVLTVGIIVMGVATLLTAPRRLVPGGMGKNVYIETRLPGASAPEMEQAVTIRLEEALRGAPKLKNFTSETINGFSGISVVPEPGADISELVEDVQLRVDSVRHLLPKDMQPPVIRSDWNDGGANSLVEFRVVGGNPMDEDFRNRVRALADKLNRLAGVMRVDVAMLERDLVVRLDREKLKKSTVPVSVVRERIRSALAPLSLGAVKVIDEDVAIEMKREGRVDFQKLKDLPLQLSRSGQGFTLGEMATVQIEPRAELIQHWVNGEIPTKVTVLIAENANVVEVSKTIRQEAEAQAKAILGDKFKLAMDADLSELLSAQLDLLKNDALIGIVLVLLLLWFFFGKRIALLAALDFPVSYLGAIAVSSLFGVDINVMSMMGLILVTGVLVDDVVVITEAYIFARKEGASASKAAILAVKRMSAPIMGMAAIVAISMAPFLISKNPEAFLIKPIAIVVVAAVLTSLLGCFLLLPGHLVHFAGTEVHQREPKLVVFMRGIYEGYLRWMLRWRWVSLILVVGLIASSIFVFSGPLKKSMGLRLSAAVYVHIELEKSTSLEDSRQQMQPLIEKINNFPSTMREIVSLRLGESRYGSKKEGFKYVELSVSPSGTYFEKEAKREELAKLLKESLEPFSGKSPFKSVEVRFNRSGGAVSDTITVYASGADRTEVKTLLASMRDAVKNTKGVLSAEIDESRIQRVVRFVPDERAILAHDMRVEDVAAQVSEYLDPREILQVREKGEEFQVRMKFTEDVSVDAKALGALTVVDPRGITLPVSMLGKFEVDEVLRKIQHRDGLRLFEVDVRYDTEKTQENQVIEAIDKSLDAVRADFPGFTISAKTDEVKQESERSFLWDVGLLLLLGWLVLTISLKSLAKPLVVLLSAVFAFVGVVFAFILHNEPFGLIAVIGLFGLFGVVSNDSLVMTTTIARLAEDEKDPKKRLQATVHAASERFQPFLITTATTFAGVLPLAYGFGGNPGWLRPLVLTIGWGLAVAATCTLALLPPIILLLDDATRLVKWPLKFFRRVKQTEPQVALATEAATVEEESSKS